MGIYNWLISAFWVVFLGVWFITALSAKKNVHRNTASVIVRILIILAAIAFFNSEIFMGGGEKMSGAFVNPLVNSIGVVLCAAGISLAIWARFNLGKNWGMPMSVKENPDLVTSGPYNYIRHPIYTGMLFAFIGSALAISLWWLVSLVVFGTYFVYSATREEKLMTEKFPGQYPAYKKRTKMLIPFVF